MRKLTAKQAAELAGVSSSTWRSYVARGRAPARDGQFGRESWWWESTVREWMASRPGRGARTDLEKS